MSESHEAQLARLILHYTSQISGRDAQAVIERWRRLASSCDARAVESALRGEPRRRKRLERSAAEWRADADELEQALAQLET